MQLPLFVAPRRRLPLAPGAYVLGGFALDVAAALLSGLDAVQALAPFRYPATPGGRPMSVANTNCGALGWVSDARGYRYTSDDPRTGSPWPQLPATFVALAQKAAAAAGYGDFLPNACLVNRYLPGAKMGLHQDRDERDLASPIVSVSLGLPAHFVWGGLERGAPRTRHELHHGDVVVWGGASRLAFHGVDALPPGRHPATGAVRYNLTLRRAG